jgi:hypothetical protein
VELNLAENPWQNKTAPAAGKCRCMNELQQMAMLKTTQGHYSHNSLVFNFILTKVFALPVAPDEGYNDRYNSQNKQDMYQASDRIYKYPYRPSNQENHCNDVQNTSHSYICLKFHFRLITPFITDPAFLKIPEGLSAFMIPAPPADTAFLTKKLLISPLPAFSANELTLPDRNDGITLSTPE